jgi:hypothetical protein
MEKVKLKIEIIPVFTFFAIRKVYRLLEMAYGEWLIMENRYPRYYFNMFDSIYDEFLVAIDNQKSMVDFLNSQFRNHQQKLSADAGFRGFYNYRKARLEIVEIEKLPPELLM